MLDTAIIGTGPAGLSAAINLKLHDKSVIWFGSAHYSDKVEKSEKIANYPGMGYITGAALNAHFADHARQLGLTVEDKMVTNIMPMGDYFMLLAENEVYEAKTVLLATGVVSARSFTGEAELLGRGVSYCATCDGMLYRNRPVAVLGYADSARHEAEFLSGIGCAVTYFDRPKTCAISGENQVQAVTCDGVTAEVDCVFILRPAVAPTELFPGLAVENSFVTVDRRMATNLPGLFAAGDCTGGLLQVSKAVGEGLIAGQSAAAFAAAQK